MQPLIASESENSELEKEREKTSPWVELFAAHGCEEPVEESREAAFQPEDQATFSGMFTKHLVVWGFKKVNFMLPHYVFLVFTALVS